MELYNVSATKQAKIVWILYDGMKATVVTTAVLIHVHSETMAA